MTMVVLNTPTLQNDNLFLTINLLQTYSPMDRISISILDINIFELEKQLNNFKELGIKRIHLDILDTSFVNNISFGPSIINTITKFDFLFDVHIMTDFPLIVIKRLDLLQIELVIIHWESKGREEALIYLKKNNCKIGVAINPSTPCNISLDGIHLVLVMSVCPGFGGQSFIKSSLEKIKDLENKIKVGVDGGINLENLHLVKNCELIVIGSSFIKSSSQEIFLKEICKILNVL